MFKRDANAALIGKVSGYVLYVVFDEVWNSAVVLDLQHAVSALHCVPESHRILGKEVVLHDHLQCSRPAKIHAMNRASDYVVFQLIADEFESAPQMVPPAPLDKYIVVGFRFGDQKPSFRSGHVSSISTGINGHFYGDSGGLPGFSGGGVFYARSGGLMGIALGDGYEGASTAHYCDVLKMTSAQMIASHLQLFNGQPYST